MRTYSVVVPPPRLDQDLCFGKAVEDFAIKQLITQAAVERFTIAILPRATRRDVKRLHPDLCQPVFHGGGNELGAVVRPYVRWWAVADEQLGQDREHVRASDPACNQQSHALPASLVDDRKDTELATIMGSALDEVVSPDMARIFRAQPDARTVVQPEPAALGLLLRYLQTLASPDALHPLAVHTPARRSQQGRHAPIAIPAILPRQGNDILGQRLLVIRPARNLALRRSVLPQNAADAAFRDRQFLADISMQRRRRAGLNSFPVPPPAG